MRKTNKTTRKAAKPARKMAVKTSATRKSKSAKYVGVEQYIQKQPSGKFRVRIGEFSQTCSSLSKARAVKREMLNA